MLSFGLGRDDRSPLRVLCIGAHADDIEIGSGGTILSLLQNDRSVSVHWVVCSASRERAEEARGAAAEFLRSAASADVRVLDFRESYFPHVGPALKEAMDDLGSEISPDLVFTHSLADRHQDHRTIAELSWNTFRDNLVLEYEIPKYEGDLGLPNMFVPIEREILDHKVELLLRCFPSQRTKDWFDRETFISLARLRGVESRSPTRYAEAFTARKVVARLGSNEPRVDRRLATVRGSAA